jgi:hypothetical protein
MSDTPRTDKAERTADTLGVMDAFEYAIYHGQKLEIELNEAHKLIKQLEGAGDAMASSIKEICYDSYDWNKVDNWNKAKETKP